MIFGTAIFETPQEYGDGFAELQKLIAENHAENTPEWQRMQLLSLAVENYELNMTLDLIDKADRRGAEMWRAGHPERQTMSPDRGKLIFWLLEQLGKPQTTTASEAESKCLEAIARFVGGLSVVDAPDDCMKMHNAAIAMVIMQIRDHNDNGDLRDALREYAASVARLEKK